MSLYPLFAWFGIDWLRIPMPITLFCACVFAYVLGRYGFNLRKLTGRGDSSARSPRENVVDELKQIADSIRNDLSDYDKRLDDFKAKIAAFDESDDEAKAELAQAARDSLASTQQVTEKISEAFDEIHEQKTSCRSTNFS